MGGMHRLKKRMGMRGRFGLAIKCRSVALIAEPAMAVRQIHFTPVTLVLHSELFLIIHGWDLMVLFSVKDSDSGIINWEF